MRRAGLLDEPRQPYICVVEALIDDTTNIASFFRDAVRGAAVGRGYDPGAPSALYVASLLADYAMPGSRAPEPLDRPLTVLLVEALGTVGPDRFERLRCLGDQALYLSGFFSDHLERRGVERRYVYDVGATAYDAAGAILRRGGGQQRGPDVFDELATNFTELVALLRDVADVAYAASAHDARGIVDLYERWTRRESPALTAALVRSGVVPSRGGGALH
jgi:hypothetical protein